MRGYEHATLESEFAFPGLDPEWETGDEGKWQKRLGTVTNKVWKQIIGGPARSAMASLLLRPSTMPFVPPVPPEPLPIVAEDRSKARRDSEAELESIRGHYPEARLMEHLGRLATRTVDGAEAEAMIGALLPLAARVVPRAEPSLMRAAPHLVRGLSGAARVLREDPATRPLVGRLPTVARRTAIDLGHRASVALPTPPEVAVRALARQAMRVLGEKGPSRASKLLEGGSSENGGSAPGPRSHGLTAAERAELSHIRMKIFNLPPSPTKSKRRIVGILITESGKRLPIHSGVSGGPWGGTHRGGIPRGENSGFTGHTLTHVEGHAAAMMHQRGIRRATLLIEKAPCEGCDNPEQRPNVSAMLPRGARLTLVDPYSATTYRSSQRY